MSLQTPMGPFGLSTGDVIRFTVPPPGVVFPTFVMEAGKRRHIVSQDVLNQSGLWAMPVKIIQFPYYFAIPPGPDLVGPEDGMLARIQGGQPSTYALLTSTLRPLVDQATIDAVLRSRADRDLLRLTWTLAANRFPVGAALVSLARGSIYIDAGYRDPWPTNADVYLSDGTYLRSLQDIDDFGCLGVAWPTQMFNQLIDLSTLGLVGDSFPSCADGNVFSDGASTSVMQGGRRHLMPDQPTVNALGPSNVVTLPKPALDFYVLDKPMTPIHIEHVVVVMLENRSFDNILGDFALENPDVNGIGAGFNLSNPLDPTVQGGPTFSPQPLAGFITQLDPGHELNNVNDQLSPTPDSGAGQPFRSNLSNNGFVYDYAKVIRDNNDSGSAPESVMKYFAGANLPRIRILAREFAICDAWFSSVPGPTMPNRFFVHAGTAAGYAKSPFAGTKPNLTAILTDLLNTAAASAAADPLALLKSLLGDPNKLEALILEVLKANYIQNDAEAKLLLNTITGSIYELLEVHGKIWAVYFQDLTETIFIPWLRARFVNELTIPLNNDGMPIGLSPMMTGTGNFRTFDKFVENAAMGTLPFYSFIHPRYGNSPDLQPIFDFISAKLAPIIAGNSATVSFQDVVQLFQLALHSRPGTDAHPPNSVHDCEDFIARVYNAVRRSPQWEKTVLVILFDEHGGFYDHVAPPTAANTDPLGRVYDSRTPGFRAEDPTFAFDRLGLRVPALIVSPFVDWSRVDHSVYDHSSLLYTVASLAGIRPNPYNRVPQLFTFLKNLTRDTARTDTVAAL